MGLTVIECSSSGLDQQQCQVNASSVDKCLPWLRITAIELCTAAKDNFVFESMDRSNRCNPSEERLISFVIDSSGGFHSSTDESNMHPNVPSPSDILTQEKSAFHYKAIVYVLIALFGLGTWTNLAGVWIELPLIVPVLPESWQLPAKLALIINSANVFPILLVFATLIFKLNTAPFEVPVNFVLLCVSITFAVGFALLWNKTASLFGTEQSFYLMVLCFLTAIADCMSSTTFIPFLHRYEPAYLNAYFAGEALTSLLPALLGVTQGVGVSECVPSFDALTNTSSIEISYQPQFSVRTYFLLLSCLPLSALVAFSTLRCMRTGRLKTQSAANRSGHHQSRVFILMENISDIPSIEQTIETIEKIEERLRLERKQEKLPIQTQLRRFAMSEAGVFLLIVFQCSAMLYGACQGLTTFSLNAYSVNTFHYTIIISMLALIHQPMGDRFLSV